MTTNLADLTPAEAWNLIRDDGGYAFLSRLVFDHAAQLADERVPCRVIVLDDHREKERM